MRAAVLADFFNEIDPYTTFSGEAPTIVWEQRQDEVTQTARCVEGKGQRLGGERFHKEVTFPTFIRA
jgi:hypothetical protein